MSRLDAAREAVRAGLGEAVRAAGAAGMPEIDLRGQLIRPLVAYAGAGGAEPLGPGFWNGVLAVQLAHEASLVHDDIVDGAVLRRGEPTVVARGGVARALVYGDHLLTSAYRLASATGSLGFAALFARAVERTVAGEIEQARGIGRVLDATEYEGVALGKAGELLGCALAVGPLVEGKADAADHYELGRRLGLLYQRLDDLLDYCPGGATGKPALGDFAQRRWTWPLGELSGEPLALPPERVADALRARAADGTTALERCLDRVEREAARLLADVRALLPADEILASLVDDWMRRAREVVLAELGGKAAARVRAPLVVSPALRDRVPATGDAVAYLAENSRSFRFAARLLPPGERDRVARVYAFCRVTDDLVDRPAPDGAEALLDEWIELSGRAYHGSPSGLALLDRVMDEMREGGVPFHYAEELVEGMRMDLRGERYETLAELRLYTHRVASVVGLWLTRLAGVHDLRVLEPAARLGHAMQLTNILRDVGEDLERGRLYLPAELLRAHSVDEGSLRAMHAGREPISGGYRALLDAVMEVAEADYAAAFAAIPELPRWFQPPVAVAARVYRGIHGAVRRNGYDNLRLRAHTGVAGKTALATGALWALQRARRGRPALAALRAPIAAAPRAP